MKRTILLMSLLISLLLIAASCGNRRGNNENQNEYPDSPAINYSSETTSTTPEQTSQPLSLKDKLAKIRNGMTESEVIAIMGAPNDRLDNYVPGFQNLFYRSGDFERVIRLQNGKVFEIMDPNEDW